MHKIKIYLRSTTRGREKCSTFVICSFFRIPNFLHIRFESLLRKMNRETLSGERGEGARSIISFLFTFFASTCISPLCSNEKHERAKMGKGLEKRKVDIPAVAVRGRGRRQRKLALNHFNNTSHRIYIGKFCRSCTLFPTECHFRRWGLDVKTCSLCNHV